MSQRRSWRGCAFIAMSLDGYIARADGFLDWLTDPPQREHCAIPCSIPAQVWDTFFPEVDAVVMGRVTYQSVLGFAEWPFADKAVIVLSSTLAEADPRVALASSIDELQRLLAEVGASRVYIDGGRTITSVLAHGLVDELTVAIAPVLLGGGIRLFGELDAEVLLTLRGTHAIAETGLVAITYDVSAAVE